MIKEITLRDDHLIELKEGFLHLPDPNRYYILDDYMDPKKCKNAAMVVPTNKYATPFVFFSNCKSVAEIPEQMKEEILNACVKKFRPFKNLLEADEPLYYIIPIEERKLEEGLDIANTEFIFR